MLPNGNRQKQNLPNGEINVVKLADSADNGICQKPELASKIEKTVTPESWANTCSTAGNGRLSRHTFSFNLVRSTQICTLPLCFGTTTSLAHHLVGSSIFSITPNCSILVNTFFTTGKRGTATWRGVVRMWFSSRFQTNMVIALQFSQSGKQFRKLQLNVITCHNSDCVDSLH